MERKPPDAEPFRLLFVCTGNTCRSPMAEAIARKRITELGWSQIEVRSAGIGAMDGSPASEGARRVAAAHGLDLSEHEATFLTRPVAESSDLILTMSAGHLVRVLELGAGDRMAMIAAFAAGGDEGAHAEGIPDPIGGPDEEYARTFAILDELIERVLERLEPVVSP
jgi:protein-tyrosine phosphatase